MRSSGVKKKLTAAFKQIEAVTGTTGKLLTVLSLLV